MDAFLLSFGVACGGQDEGVFGDSGTASDDFFCCAEATFDGADA